MDTPRSLFTRARGTGCVAVDASSPHGNMTMRVSLVRGGGPGYPIILYLYLARGGTGAKVKKADRESWYHEGRCPRCTPITLRSGDVLLFDGNPDAAVAHGVQNTVASTAPGGLPRWCYGGRTSVQFRLTAMRGLMGGMGGGC